MLLYYVITKEPKSFPRVIYKSLCIKWKSAIKIFNRNLL